MWQHSRMFGYDRDPGMMRVFIDEPLYKLFSDIQGEIGRYSNDRFDNHMHFIQ